MITNSSPADSGHMSSPRKRWPIVALLLLVLIVATIISAYAADFPLILGYADFQYIIGEYTEGTDVMPEPTDKAVESKLWWHDGSWWGVMYSPAAGEYHIYRLATNTQEWEDTGVLVDPREGSRADVLWDAGNNRLYIATHLKQENPSNENTNPANWAYLQQYEYNAGSQSWNALDNTIEDGTGVITNYIVESLVLDMDSTGRLWATYVVRRDETAARVPTVPGGGTPHYYVALSTTDDPSSWTTPELWTFPEAEVSIDDISGLVAFTDAGGPKVGLMWSNQLTGEFYFYTRNDSDPVGDWTQDSDFEALKTAEGSISADDHMNFAVTAGGDLFAIVKTSADAGGGGGEPDQIGLFTREGADGSWSWRQVSPVGSVDTRPLVLINETTDTVYAFSVSSTGGGTICYQDAAIPADLSALSFPAGGCDPSDPFGNETIFIEGADDGCDRITNPTSTKQRVTDSSGMVVLATDDTNGHWYVHNMEGGGAPAQPPAASPSPCGAGGATTVYLPAING